MTEKRVAVLGSQVFSLVNFRADLMRDMRALGHEVYALAPEFDANARKILEADGIVPIEISLSRTGLNPLRDFMDIIRLWRTLSGLKPDILLSIAIKPVIYGTWAAVLSRVPRRYAMIPGLGYSFGQNTSRQRLLGLATRLFYRMALVFDHGVFMQNREDAHELVAAKIVLEKKILAIRATGVDLSEWTASPPVEKPACFVLAARLLPEKGIRQFVAAAQSVKAVDPRARFVILGGLDDNPSSITGKEMQAWVDEGLIKWPGHVEVRPWLEQCSVFVLPSYYREGVPRSIQEAMAMGRPIITTDWIGCRDTVIEGENGFLVPPYDVKALAQAMLNFIENPKLVTEMGAKSRRLAEQRYDVHTINRDIISRMEL